MIQRSKTLVFPWSLGLLTLVTLLANVPATDHVDLTVGLFFAGIVGLMLNLGTMLDEVVVSPAPTAALMIYLSIGEDKSVSAALWSVAAGALTGTLIWLARKLPSSYSRHSFSPLIRNAAISTAQLTLGLFIGGWAYRQFGGRLPLDQMNRSDILPLAGFAAIYLAFYLSILLIEANLYRRRTPHMVAQYGQGLVGVTLLPLPFAVLGAVVYHELSGLAFGTMIGGLMIIVAGVHQITQAQARSRQQVLELSALSTVSQAMRTNLDLDALLDVVYRQVAHLLNVGNFAVALFDSSRNTLYFPLNIRNHRPVSLTPREVEQGLIEYVIQEKTALLLTDQVARRAHEMTLTPPPMPVYSWLGVPLLTQDRVLGCMVVYSSRPDQHFTRRDLHLLTTIAGQTGISIDNAQLYGQSRDRGVQIATLNNVAALLSGTLDAQQILDLTGSSAVAVASCDAVALYMWWEGTHRPLSLARHNGLSDEFVSDPPRPLLMDIDDLQRRRQPVIVTDAHIDQRTRELRAKMDRENKRAWIEYLLRKGDEMLGILVFYYGEPRNFNAEEVELLRNFTNQSALAISNARLYTQTDEALQRRVEQLSALADISQELTATLNLQRVFQLVLDRALEATQSRNGILMLRTADEKAVPSLVAHRGFDPDALNRIEPMTGHLEHTYLTGQATLIPDVSHEEDFTFLDDNTRAQLHVPVLWGNEVLGVISLGSDRPNDYSHEDASFVTQLADQARIAIDNARLFRRVEIARDRLQVILDSMKEGVVLIGAEGKITLANPCVKWLLGLDPRDVMGIPIAELLENPSLGLAERLGFGEATLRSVVKNLSEGWWDESSRDGGRVTFQVAAPEKVHFIDRTDAPVRDEGGHAIGLLMVFADVTEKRDLDQAREDLSNMIVHDLRGPLTAVTTSLKLLNEIASPDDPLGKAVKQTTEMSSRAVRKLLNLVDSLLDISKLESGVITLERELTALAPMCALVVDELVPLAKELDVGLSVMIPPDLPILNVDTEKIERVLLNLVDNAIKFTPSGGCVTIQATELDTMRDPEKVVQIEVVDTGPGVPDPHKERLFDRFAQLDGLRGHRRGTGLGLTFCKLAVEAHGGRIWIEDNPQGGAIFSLTLPVANLDEWERFA